MATPPPPQVVETSESQKTKTWILKVSIPCACAGCIKKVKNKLLHVPGVETVDVEAKQHKVTVTGNVEGNSLLQKLNKRGHRIADLWPQEDIKIKEKENKKEEILVKVDKGKSPIAQNIQKQNLQSPQNIQPSDDKPEQKAPKVTQNQETILETGSAGIRTENVGVVGEKKKKKGQNSHLQPDKVTEAPKIVEGDDKSTAAGTGESKSEEKKLDTGLAGTQSPSPTMEIKKKNKGQKGHFDEGDNYSVPPLRSGISNQNPPGGYGYDYPPPPHYHAPPPVMSYNMAHPSTSQTTSYYAPPPSQSYSYSHPGYERQGPALDYNSSYASQPLDSFELISDENPNGCSIM